ncbi:sensor histidine kinase [Niabella terrae]
MNRSQIDNFLQSRLFRYIARILVLYCLSVVFRTFDMSFNRPYVSTFLRGQLFSLMMVVVGLIIWEGASRLSRLIQKRMAAGPTVLFVTTLCLSMGAFGILGALLFGLVYSVFDIVIFNRYEAWESFSVLSYDLIFGAFIFYLLILGFNGIIFYFRNWQEAQLKAEQLRRQHIQARYEVLQNQIDPHFFFNSLSVLTNLVYKSADLSAEYITQLSKCYRYILDKKMEYLVTVQEELSFLQSYIFLINIRHQDNIQFRIDLDETVRETWLPPAALQMLVENAVKHNTFFSEQPLEIYIHADGTYIIVENQLRKRTGIMSSTGIGLYNIRKRYELLSTLRVEVAEEDGKFLVKLPILKTGQLLIVNET